MRSFQLGVGFVALVLVLAASSPAVRAGVLVTIPRQADAALEDAVGSTPGETTISFIMPQGGEIEKVELQLAMDHSYPGDLTATLSAPGQTVTLFFELENTGIDNFTELQDVLFSGAASGYSAIAPLISSPFVYSGGYQVQGVGTTGMDAFSGLTASVGDTWTLTITDYESVDTGTLYGTLGAHAWQIGTDPGTADGTKLLVTLVPEPASSLLLLVGGPLIIWARKRYRTKR